MFNSVIKSKNCGYLDQLATFLFFITVITDGVRQVENKILKEVQKNYFDFIFRPCSQIMVRLAKS